MTDIHDEKVAFGLYIRSPGKVHPSLTRDENVNNNPIRFLVQNPKQMSFPRKNFIFQVRKTEAILKQINLLHM